MAKSSATVDVPEAFSDAFEADPESQVPADEGGEQEDGPPVQLIAIPDDEAFAVQQSQTGERDYIFSKELAAIGAKMIADYPELVHLADFRIAYAWKRRGGEVKGRAQFGNLVRGNSLLRMLGATDFVVWLAADHARDYVLSAKQRDAALYHQMVHCSVDDFGKPFMVNHDLEMFVGEVERFGLWSLDLKQAAPVLQQVPLDLG